MQLRRTFAATQYSSNRLYAVDCRILLISNPIHYDVLTKVALIEYIPLTRWPTRAGSFRCHTSTLLIIKSGCRSQVSSSIKELRNIVVLLT
jgi:hypothetical protein